MRQSHRLRADQRVLPAQPAVLYLRVSSKEQEREGFSIPAQRKLLQQYALDQGFQIVREFEDIETAKRSGRQAFTAMIGFLQKSSCKVVLVEKTDRLYRNTKDWVTVADLDVEVHLVKEGTILSEHSRSSEKFMHGIRVLMAKNYIDNLSKEVRKGMREKAEQGHWPTVAHIGYINDTSIRRIDVDPERGPLVAKLFEWYATGMVSLQELTRRAATIDLTHPRSGRKLTKSEIHRVLHNPIYAGEFSWKGKLYPGQHTPIISRRLFEDVQDVFESQNRPRYKKHQHAFTGLMTCAVCGCAMTAESKKGRYVYYHCTGFKGRCGNTWVREEELVRLFADALQRIQITSEVAEWIKVALRESQDDKERYHRTAILRLQQQYIAVRAKIDRAYEDRLAGRVSDDLWQRKSREWEQELADVQRDTALHESASHDYASKGSEILELAQTAPAQFVTQNPAEQARLLKMPLSNCSFDRGSLSVA